MTRAPTVYLAGPEVFLPDALEVGKRKQDLCRQYGLIGLFPLDNVTGAEDHKIPRSKRISDNNVAMMRRADAIIANLTPFRGPGADGGTVFELGFMSGLSKPCFGYSNAASTYLARAIETHGGPNAGDVVVDNELLSIEDFDLYDNLMIHHAAELSGAPFVVPLPSDAPEDRWRDMRQFERCLRKASEIISLPGIRG